MPTTRQAHFFANPAWEGKGPPLRVYDAIGLGIRDQKGAFSPIDMDTWWDDGQPSCDHPITI
jgi:hypothetical protein